MNSNVFEYDERLDSAFLESIYDGDMEHAAISFEQFLNKYAVQIKEIEDCLAAADINLLRQKLHKIKPAFSYVGLTSLTAKAEIIERMCTDDTDKIVLTDLYLDFKNELNKLIPVVEGELERLKA
jgi:HPt (histidine-containing phosphotransfer) domain-containing protein